MLYLAVAYGGIWLLIFGYLAVLGRKQGQLEERLEALTELTDPSERIPALAARESDA